jgi:cytochrome c-type biogenesis protein CcmE
VNHWPFIIAAYGLTIAGTLGVTLWSLLAMRRAEAEADALRRDDEAKHQRLTLARPGDRLRCSAPVCLSMSALPIRAALFLCARPMGRKGVPLDRAVRIGGMGKDGSIQREPTASTSVHRRRRERATIPVRYTGITPDLFKENSGVVAEGRFQPNGTVVADEILAKHDENYMPPELARTASSTRPRRGRGRGRIAEVGLAALWLAAALSVLQLCVGAIALRPGGEALMASVRPIAIAQALLVALSFLALIQLFLRTDLSVQLVAANSHSAKPWLYKFAGTWGNHEGSMLLWVAILGIGRAAPSPGWSGGSPSAR